MPDPTTAGPLSSGTEDRLPLSVWVTGQTDPQTQLAAGPYVAETAAELHRINPAVAAHAIARYTRPGALVADPDCGTGTTLVEALRAGRHAVGIAADRRSWETARANLTAAKRTGAFTDGMVLASTAGGDVNHLVGLAGRVDLVLTAARPRLVDPGPAADLTAVLARARELLRTDGHLVLALPRVRRHGHLVDLADLATTAARANGLVAVDRCVALLAELRGHRVLTHASLAHRRAAERHRRTTGHPMALHAHQDLLVFQPALPTAATTVATRRTNPARFTVVVPAVRRDDLAALSAA
ncbi:DNA methyltransferase [Actinokineospora sp. NBRC 105648]|uniref:TRM11 family SAM-dependent methyltransferase n=1 Tax=Actinokineospora sp. NBRC 105648 TaxID=3032206 RepID=UPI0024A36886|nr:DNA methyltransferase [Actinokineospora sp. NBRC 105648]GLZ37851.1 hypothetical protein Acsp05_14750 [Actinokineospora sp. NBRC 105648]